ncbi:MAG TPA: response regulator [Campylobacterales bacterium]|nr:response regulator [Campylobacterales bacterium]
MARYNFCVLFVEDEESIRGMIGGYLQRLFKDLHYASNGEEGLEKFLEVKPDIVITDIEMPKMDGLLMCSKIKQINQNTHIIFTTAFSEPEQIEAANKLGAAAYLVKPIDYDELTSIIAGLLEKSSAN